MQEFANTALLQDDVLIRVASVLDYGYAPGPAFVSALSTLVEAVVLHETVYFDAFGDFGTTGPEDAASTTSLLEKSAFVRALISGGALHLAPRPDALDGELEARGLEYRWIDFIQDAKWQYASFVPATVEGEQLLYARQATLLREYPGIFAAGRLIDDFSVPGTVIFANDAAAALAQAGVPTENLVLIEGYNFLASAYVSLARHLGLNLYLYDAAFPHQLANVEYGNTRVRELVAQVLSEASRLDADIGESEYRHIAIPALTRSVLNACKDAPGALADETLKLRDKHGTFRRCLTEYDVRWRGANTLNERIQLKRDFANAWDAELQRHKARRQRLIYTLWDVLKEPTKLLIKIGDKLAEAGKRQSVVGRARGLNTFWDELLDAPLRADLPKLFRNLAPESVWEAAARYAAEVKKLREVRGGLS